MQKRTFFTRYLPAAFIAGAAFALGATSMSAAIKGSAIFVDVPSTHYANDAIGEMYSLGIIKGLDNTHFGPDQSLTRGQAALLFQRLRNELKGITPAASSSSSASTTVSSSSSSSSMSSSSSSSSSYNPGGSIRFDSNAYNVDKNVAAGTITIVIVRIGGNSGAGTVKYAFSGGTAIANQDYVPQSGTLTFNNKETSAKVVMTIKNNQSSTGTKTVMLTLSNPTGALSLGSPSTVTLNINDPNVSSSSTAAISSSAANVATVGFSALSYGVMENGGNITITVNRTGVTTNAVGVSYSTSNGTAQSGADYSGVSGTLSFGAGETSKTFTVSVGDNASVDGSKTFNVVLSSPTGGAVLGTASAPVMINDNEAAGAGSGTIKFSSQTYNGSMSAGSATITINHPGGVQPVSVNYATGGGSATAGTEYASTSGTLYFAQGESSKTITIPLYSYTGYTGGKTVILNLSSPVGAPLGDTTTATLTINN